MKNTLIAVLMILAWAAPALAQTTTTTSVPVAFLTTPSSVTTNEIIGTEQADKKSIIWYVDKGLTGGFFDFTFVDGDAITIKCNWYFSWLTTGDTDWKEYMPKSPTTGEPTAHDLKMPSVSATWPEPIPFPDYIRRVKMAVTEITGGTPTDTLACGMHPFPKP